jgi:hypothetical protein
MRGCISSIICRHHKYLHITLAWKASATLMHFDLLRGFMDVRVSVLTLTRRMQQHRASKPLWLEFPSILEALPMLAGVMHRHMMQLDCTISILVTNRIRHRRRWGQDIILSGEICSPSMEGMMIVAAITMVVRADTSCSTNLETGDKEKDTDRVRIQGSLARRSSWAQVLMMGQELAVVVARMV